MIALRARCPAKINLALRVRGLRSDGYHDLVTLFQAIALADELAGSDSDSLSLELTGAAIAADESNLVIRAGRLLQERVPAARGRGARLRLAKAIPAGAGLGGGSSDAAGALLLLNTLWDLRLTQPELGRLAAEIGSDVPFFLTGGTALGTGRGETIDPLPPIPRRSILLASPPFGLATPEVYRALRAPLTVPGADVTVPLFVKFAAGNDFALAQNDLETVAFAMRPELAGFRDAMSRSGAEVALLSGSGSTVFGMFPEGTDVMPIADSLRGRFPDWTFRPSRTINSGVQVWSAVR